MPNAINFGEVKVSESRAQYKEKRAFLCIAESQTYSAT
jgi:hypothetical protein